MCTTTMGDLNDLFGSSSVDMGGHTAVTRELQNRVNALRREIENVELETWCYERYEK